MQNEKSDHIALLSTILPVVVRLLCQGIAVIFIASTVVTIIIDVWGINQWLSIILFFSISTCFVFVAPEMKNTIKEFSYIKGKLGH